MSVIAMKRFPVQTRAAKSPPAVNSRPSGLLLQRKCLAGRSAGLIGEHEEYFTKRLPGKALQAKLRINESGDEYEKEADRMVEQIIRMPDVTVDHETSSTGGGPLVQRRTGETSEAGTGVAPPIVHDLLSSPGQPLDVATRAFFEPRFGHDFSRVRIHSDLEAEKSAKAVGALAYTVGQDIVFGLDGFALQSIPGRRLLAHELSHVIQQSATHKNEYLQRATGSDPAPKQDETPVSLAMEISGSHEIVIDGQPFELVVISTPESLKGTSAKYRSAAEDYLGSYPNLGGGLWAFIVKPGIVRLGDSPYCPIGGNCLGWANGTFDVNDPPGYVWSLVPQYFESIDLTGSSGRTSEEAYLNQARDQKFPADAIWDYFMKVTFHALPTDRDGEAHLALYGRGLAGSVDGPSHISFRTGGGEFWVSKPSPTKFPVVHEQAGQMSGDEVGNFVRLYKRESGPLNHIVVRPKQAQPTNGPQEPMSR
jgi:hypothetical protein